MLFWFLPLALLALGLTAALVLFLNVKREMDVQARINRVRWDDMLTRLRVAEPAAQTALAGMRQPRVAFSAMNQNTRIQAVRLLLVRVHELSSKRAGQASSLTTAVRTTETMLTMSAPKNAGPNPST